jgi:hypothetical protein
MSIRVMSLVWDNFDRKGTELVVMLALSDWCNDQGGSLYPSIAGVAKKARISESQARRVIHKFIDDGFLSVIANHNGGDNNQTRHYKINIEMLATPSTHASGDVMNIDREICVTPSTHATPSMDATPSTHARLPLAPMRVTPSTHDTLTTINHHKNHHKEQTCEKAQSKTKSWDISQVVLPEYIDPDSWFAFVAMRNAKKKPIRTANTAKLILDELDKFKQQGLDPNDSLKTSTRNDWTDVYEPKTQVGATTPTKISKWARTTSKPTLRTIEPCNEPTGALSHVK